VRVEEARPLAGMRIGVAQTRHARELAALIEREGGVPLLAPCLREVHSEDGAELQERLVDVTAAPVRTFVFQTGVGTRALFDLAAAAGLAERLTATVAAALVVARGPKPLAVLLRLGFRVDRRTVEPHTTAEVVALLDAEELAGHRVAVQHYGTANRALVSYLRSRGADVIELSSYRWALPEDVGPIMRLLDELRAGTLAVTAFTSASQVENLFTVAADAGLAGDLPEWLNRRTVTAAIGPTCAGALEQRGVAVAIQPGRPKMVPFVRAISDHFAARATDGG
jgi:uroporphyrinogen-III synthase